MIGLIKLMSKIWTPGAPMNTDVPKKKTPAEVLAGANPGDEVLFSNCPHCGEPIGIVIGLESSPDRGPAPLPYDEPQQ